MDTAQLLLAFSALCGVSGHEAPAVAYAQRLLEAYGTTQVTPLGSLLCTVRAPKPGQPHILLDAHIDEIGMIVTYIEDSGFLRVGACGGIDRRLLLASPVSVHTREGVLPGVVCSIPPHLSTDADKKNKKVDEIYIDTGYSKEEVQEKIQLGDRVTITSHPRALLGDTISGKAIDDRAGCVAHLHALKLLADEELECGLTVLFSSMEEVGGQGAKTAAYSVQPTHAIVVDVSFAHTPDAVREKCGLLGKGPMIGFAPILDNHMSRDLVTIAKEKGIPYQIEAMGGSTGTNADSIAIARGGVKTALLSIPQKYMHMPIESVTVRDVENTGALIANYIRSLKGGAQ